MANHRVLTLLFLALTWEAAAAQELPGPSDTDAIREWVRELEHNSFRVREAATAQLARAGIAAVDPTSAAISQGSLEVIVRGVQILRQLAMSPDRPTAAAARRALHKLGTPDVSTAAGHARSALNELAQFDEERAYKDFERLGGRLGSGSANEGPPTLSHAVLGKGWEGDSDDVQLLNAMTQLDRLSIFGPRITDSAVPHIAKLTRLKRLELYGTKLSADSIQKIRNALRSTDIEERRGGLLGVAGTLNSVDCLITSVRPNSSAERAGIQAGDVVIACQGKPVQGFQSLTEIIATHDGGETIEMTFLRGGVKLTVQATLGEWE